METHDDTREDRPADALSADDLFAQTPWPVGARAIILLDLDAFFASVEQLDHPEWRGKPVIVGGSPSSRGVVSTASYEARAYGVHSAMASAVAERLCPDAIWTPGNFARYHEVSQQVMDILRSVTPFVQQVSIDEAFADITPSAAYPDHPAGVAAAIQARVFGLGVTCSIGLATSKALAKIASEVDKPRGLTVVYPGREEAFVSHLPIRALSGIGRATEERLQQAGFQTLGDVFRADEETLTRAIGKNGRTVFWHLHGADPVITESGPPKSVSREVTFASDLTTADEVERATLDILAQSCHRLRKTGRLATTLTVKVHFDANTGKSAQVRLREACADEYRLKDEALSLVRGIMVGRSRARLIGVALSGLVDGPDAQEALPLEGESQKRPRSTAELVEAADRINRRFGAGSLQAGRSLYRSLPTKNSATTPGPV